MIEGLKPWRCYPVSAVAPSEDIWGGCAAMFWNFYIQICTFWCFLASFAKNCGEGAKRYSHCSNAYDMNLFLLWHITNAACLLVVMMAGSDGTGTLWATYQQTRILWEGSGNLASRVAAEEEVQRTRVAGDTFEAWKQSQRPRSQGLSVQSHT